MKSLQKIGVLTWAFYFLLTTTGISLSYLYCHCVDAEYFSLFSSVEHSCDQHKKTKKQVKSCCEKSNKQCKKPILEEVDHKDDDCCTPNAQYVKADIDVFYSQKFVKNLDFSIVVALPNVTQNNTFQVQNDILEHPYYRPPPKRHGIELRHFIQSYLC